MKKKIALLLAAVMALTALPMTNVFALSLAQGGLNSAPLLIKNEDVDITQGQIDLGIDFKDVTFAQVGKNVDVALDLTNAEWKFDNLAPGSNVQDLTNSNGKVTGKVYHAATYDLTVVDVLKSQAIFKVTSIGALSDTAGTYSIPLVVNAKGGSGSASVKISGNTVPDATFTFAVPSTSSTTVVVNNKASDSEDLTGIKLSIQESRPNVIEDGYFTIVLPDGVTFNKPIPNGYGSAGLAGAVAEMVKADDNYALYHVNLQNLSAAARNYQGSIVIENLSLNVDRDIYSAGDDIAIDILNDNQADFDYDTNNDANISDASGVVIGTVVDEGIAFSVGDAETVTTGLYPTDNYSGDIDTAKVTFSESAIGSWNTNKNTTFTLPDGVYFRAVQFKTSDNVKSNGASLTSNNDGKLLVGGQINGSDDVKLTKDTLTLNGLDVDANNKAKIEFVAYLSVSADYTDESIDLTMSTRGFDDQAVTVATVRSPFTFSYDETKGVLTITENYVGAFAKGKDLTVEMADTKDRITLPRGVNVDEITDALDLSGNLNKSTSLTSGMSIGGSSFVITNKRLSTSRTGAGSFEVTGLPIVSADDYIWLTVGGEAVAANYKYLASNVGKNQDSMFDAVGYELGLGKAADTQNPNAPTKVGTYTSTFVIASTDYTVNGESKSMDAAPFISAEGNTMVPIRYLAYALGFTDEQIIWNEATNTVTLVAPNQYVVQITVGSANASVNGTTVLMVDAAGNPVSAVNKADRVYLPLRAVSNLFGATVAWDADSQTITIN